MCYKFKNVFFCLYVTLLHIMISCSFAVELSYQAPPLDNPLKGMVPFTQKSANTSFPHSLEFEYIPLSDVLKGVNPSGGYIFDWSTVEAFLESARLRGHQGIFRIYSEYPGRPVSVPQFLIDEGLSVTPLVYGGSIDAETGVLVGGEIAHTPDYTNPAFLDALKATIIEMGAVYDNDARIGFLELGMLGVWGEWHNYSHSSYDASTEVRGEILDAYEGAFQDTKLLTRYPRGVNAGVRSNVDRRIGYHDDSYTYSTLGEPNWRFIQLLQAAKATEKWKSEPLGGELFPSLNECLFEEVCVADDGIIASGFIETVETIHTTYMRVGVVFDNGLSESRKEEAYASVRRMGYDLHIDEASITPEINNTFSVSAKLVNYGVAPFYKDWPITVGLINSEGNVIQEWVNPNWKLNGLISGEERIFNGSFTASSAIPTGAKVAIRVPNPMAGGIPLRFSNYSQQIDGLAWMVLGGMDGSPPESSVPKALFIRGGIGTVGFLDGGDDEQGSDVFNYSTEEGNHGWGELNSALLAEGFEVIQVSEGPMIDGVPTPVAIESMILKQYSVIVFGSNNAEYSDEQVDALTSYIEGGGSALFISDANFGQNWGDSASSDSSFLERYGLMMNQEAGSYEIRRANEFIIPTHPILNGVNSFDGGTVSPVTVGLAPAGVKSSLITSARFNVRRNTGEQEGPIEAVTAQDGSLVVASLGTGRVASHFNRNTFFNERGEDTNMNRLNNEIYARNLFNWLVGRSTASSNFSPRAYFHNITSDTTVREKTEFKVTVVAKDPDGDVSSVVLSIDGVVIGSDATSPYEFTVPGVELGEPIISATVTDNLGASTQIHTTIHVRAIEPAINRSDWIVTSSQNGDNVGKAIDGDLSSRWDTATAQVPGQIFSVNFGKRETFAKIVIDTTPSANDYPRGYIVRASQNGVNYTVVASGDNVNALTEIRFKDPLTYQYIEIEQTGSAMYNWWSIHEINVFQPAIDAAVPLQSWLQRHYSDEPPALESDSDGDGLTLLEEYAFNSDPLTSSIDVLPKGKLGMDAEDQSPYIDYTYRRWEEGEVNDVSYTVQASNTLSTWDSSSFNITYPFAVVVNGDGTETVVARVKFESLDDKGFVRMLLKLQ